MLFLALLLQAPASLPSPLPQDAPEIRVTAPGKAFGQTPATLVVEPVGMFLAACDADGDAETTRNEMQDCVARSFAAFDTGKTGQLRYFPFADWAERYLGDRNALPSPFDVDRDGDNQVSLDELQAHFSRLFTRFDRNKDGALSRAELLTIRTTAADANGPVPDPAARGPRKERRDRR